MSEAAPDPDVLVPATTAALDDLAVLLARAERASPTGAARLQVTGGPGGRVLAVSVAPLATVGAEDPGLPVVLGMRVLALADAEGDGAEAGVGGLDATVPLRALLDRLAHARSRLPLPPERVLGASWAGVSPPRQGWWSCGSLEVADLLAAAAAGARHVAAGQPRGAVWSRPLPGTDGLPAGAALAADVLGFLGSGEGGGAPTAQQPPATRLPATVSRSGPWWRLSTAGGHVLARRPSLLG